VKDRLYQNPFPQYTPDAVIPGSDVIMVTTPSTDIIPNSGHGGLGSISQATQGRRDLLLSVFKFSREVPTQRHPELGAFLAQARFGILGQTLWILLALQEGG
jgi:hypothetical protein